MAGSRNLKLAHPAELVLRLRRSDRLSAEELCAELAIAERSLEGGCGRLRLPDVMEERADEPPPRLPD